MIQRVVQIKDPVANMRETFGNHVPIHRVRRAMFQRICLIERAAPD